MFGKTVFGAAFFLVSVSGLSLAGTLSSRIVGEHFTVYYQRGVDPLDVAQKIGVRGSVYLYKDESRAIIAAESPREVLTRELDNLFKEVSGILDMSLHYYHGNIKIYRDRQELQDVFRELFSQELEAEAFYFAEENAIFISAADITAGILAHEMAHAIINHFFVVMPPEKIQEVLAGYVEYHINRMVALE